MGSDINSFRVPMPWQRNARYATIRPVFSGRSVLEVGASDGNSAIFLAEHAQTVLSVDWDASVIAEARKTHVRENLTFRVADPLWLSRSNEAFDVVLVPEGNVLLREDGFLPEVKRVLHPEGCLFVVVRSDSTHAMHKGELFRRLRAYFQQIRIAKECPFVGLSVHQDGELLQPTLDTQLIVDEPAVSTWWGLAANCPIPPIGPVIMQIPLSTLSQTLPAALPAPPATPVAQVVSPSESDLADRLAQAEAQAKQAQEQIGSVLLRAASEIKALKQRRLEQSLASATPATDGATIRRLVAALERMKRAQRRTQDRVQRAELTRRHAQCAQARLEAERIGDLWQIEELMARLRELQDQVGK